MMGARLTINEVPMEAASKMQVSELKQALSAFNQTTPVMVAIPVQGEPHRLRAIATAGHLDHPGEVKNAPDHPGALDIACGAFDGAVMASSTTVADLAKMIDTYPDTMHVRVAVPVTHDSWSHRMLDIAMLGHAVGSGVAAVQLICESWNNTMQIVKEFPEVVAKRLSTATVTEAP